MMYIFIFLNKYLMILQWFMVIKLDSVFFLAKLKLYSVSDETYANVKWEELGFGFVRTDNMYVAKCNHGESFQEGKIVPYADFQISPCSAVLNYGQVCYNIHQ